MAAPSGTAPMGLSRADIEAIFALVRNWGRWGEADERGTLNLVTAHHRRAALALVRDGSAIGCGVPIGGRPPASGTTAQVHITDGGDVAPPVGFGRSRDWLSVGPHGVGQTHLDALCHVFYDGRMYNDRPATEVRSTGAVSNGVGVTGDGIVGRGVLLDIAALSEAGYVDPTAPVRIGDLEEAEGRAGVDVGEGDLLMIRVGRWGREARAGGSTEAPEPAGGPLMAGLHPECLTWLHRRQVALLGSDAAHDVLPGPFAVRSPIHVGALVYMGLPLLDNAQLDALAVACTARAQWTFLFVVAPLRLVGATGCVVNPVAVV
jgi:kynurenine formamidase